MDIISEARAVLRLKPEVVGIRVPQNNSARVKEDRTAQKPEQIRGAQMPLMMEEEVHPPCKCA